ncbi:ABC transporter substrate-binding protein [Duganella callida]|uniref:ABC transporter substrate-binding protein n=1 Tax=Duganella callida TaxID=2561932 RepID=A0A4Y9SGW4_9BURK|nr:ABC transporter substrate-binding protein [Duganella callida]TFW22900.1 ABC transporter substrate-binding protein [Duganella callida]
MTQERKPATIWYSRGSIPTPLGLSAQLGLYDKEFAADGITIKSLQDSDNPAELASHFEHNLPDSFRLGGAVQPIWARAKGRDTRVIGISWIDEYQVILALPESGIVTPRDLKGRRLGLPKQPANADGVDVNRAEALRGLLVALETAGLGHPDAEWIDVAARVNAVAEPDSDIRRGAPHRYTALVHALVRGEVDAIYVKDVRGAEVAHLLDARVVLNLGFHPDRWVRVNNCTPRPLTVNALTLRQHPDLVRRFLGSIASVDAWARRNPGQALSHIARETSWSESWVRFAYGDRLHEKLGVNLADDALTALEQFKRYLLQWQFIQRDFDLAGWIDATPLRSLGLA